MRRGGERFDHDSQRENCACLCLLEVHYFDGPCLGIQGGFALLSLRKGFAEQTQLLGSRGKCFGDVLSSPIQ